MTAADVTISGSGVEATPVVTTIFNLTYNFNHTCKGCVKQVDT